ncbi:hydantoinase/carbamoylase family amidase [Granulosicoccus sp.]|nr:hydantoinase/carbamoylase family amidase [Granulosicoccus sp.]MDB4222546.1 hydantoinase/carbamoylase family amidase [Granulosicoccus sp.]
MKALETARRLFEELAHETADEPGITRDSYGEGEAKAHAMILREAQRIGLEQRCDDFGNLFITLPGLDRNAPVLMTGSHIDSVPHGGNYDGAAGVLAGIALLEYFSDEPSLPFDVVLMVIRAEEMIWFPEHYLGSRAAFGLLPADTPNRLKRSDTGITLAHYMRKAGFNPDAITEQKTSLSADKVRAFIELHIEQGPVLKEQSIPVGIVTGIRGNRRYRFCSINGQTTHAGGVPRRSRRDAVLAGAELVSALESFWIQLEDQGHDLVLTIGEFTTDHAQHGITKVPGRLDFTLDFRSQSSSTLDEFDIYLQQQVVNISLRRNVEFSLGTSTQASEALMDKKLIEGLSEAAIQAGVSTMPIPSGGGHDCAVFAGQLIPSAMIFVRNDNGSHNPDESMEFEDFSAAFTVLVTWLGAHTVQYA